MSKQSNESSRATNVRGFLRRRIVKALIAALLCWVAYILAGNLLRQVAVEQIAELTGSKVKIKSVDFKLNGSIKISDLLISPLEEERYDNTILKAKTVYARFSTVSLLAFKPRLKKISIKDFIFNAQYDSDSARWNITSLKLIKPSAGAGKLPAVRLKRGVIQYSKVSNGQVNIVLTQRLNAELAPADGENLYSLYITNGGQADLDQIDLKGTWQKADLSKIKLTGRIDSITVPIFNNIWNIRNIDVQLEYDADNIYIRLIDIQSGQKTRITLAGRIDNYHTHPAFEVNIHIKDLFHASQPVPNAFVYTPSVLKLLGGFLQKFFIQYNPKGLVDMNVQAAGIFKELPKLVCLGKIICKDVSIRYQKFPYLLEHLTGVIDLTEKSAVLNDLQCKHGDVELRINGYSRNSGPDWDCKIELTSANMLLDDDVYQSLNKRQKKFWLEVAPTGRCAIEYLFEHKPNTAGKASLTAQLLGAAITYQYFPYPLRDLTGTVLIEPDKIKLTDVVSQYDGRCIRLDGKITDTHTEYPGFTVSIRADKVPIDSALRNALPDSQKEFYEHFHADGFVDADINVFPSEQDKHIIDYTAELSIKAKQLKYDKFPLSLRDVSLRASLRPDSVHLENLTAKWGTGKVFINGKIQHPTKADEKIRYRLCLNAEGLETSSDLKKLLLPGPAQILSQLQMEGQVNIQARLNNIDTNQSPENNIIVECLGNRINFEKFSCPLRNVKGTVVISNDNIELKNITAIRADNARTTKNGPAIKLDGHIALDANGFSGGQFHIFACEALFDDQFSTALNTIIGQPKHKILRFGSVADAYPKLAPTARVDLNIRNIQGGDLHRTVLVGFENIGIEQFFLTSAKENNHLDNDHITTDANENPVRTIGKMSGSLAVIGPVSSTSSRTGRLKLSISDMKVGKASLLAKLLYLLNLTQPKDFIFSRMTIDAYIKGDELLLQQVDIRGDAVAMRGSGRINLQTKAVDLDFTAGQLRLASAPLFIESLTEGLSGAFVRMKITGNFGNPQIKTTPLPVIKDTLSLFGEKPRREK